MLRSKGTQALMAKLRKDRNKLVNNLAETHRNLVAAQFVDLVFMTPQWSGNLASNWRIEFTGHEDAYSPAMKYGKHNKMPYSIGSDPVVRETVYREFQKIPAIRYNTKVTFVNHTSYAQEVQQGHGPNGKPLRPENLIYGPTIMTAYLETKYKSLKVVRKAVNI